MINANLLPPEVKKDIAQAKKNAQAVRYNWLATLILVAAIIIAGLSWFYFKNEATSAENDLKAKQSNSTVDIALQQKAKNLAGRINAIKSIDSNSNKWSDIISEVQNVMPNGVYLNSVKIDSDSRNRGSISGYAATQQAVADLRDAIEKSSKFQYADIDSSKEQTDALTQKKVLNFTITFSLEKGALK